MTVGIGLRRVRAVVLVAVGGAWVLLLTRALTPRDLAGLKVRDLDVSHLALILTVVIASAAAQSVAAVFRTFQRSAWIGSLRSLKLFDAVMNTAMWGGLSVAFFYPYPGAPLYLAGWPNDIERFAWIVVLSGIGVWLLAGALNRWVGARLSVRHAPPLRRPAASDLAGLLAFPDAWNAIRSMLLDDQNALRDVPATSFPSLSGLTRAERLQLARRLAGTPTPASCAIGVWLLRLAFLGGAVLTISDGTLVAGGTEATLLGALFVAGALELELTPPDTTVMRETDKAGFSSPMSLLSALAAYPTLALSPAEWSAAIDHIGSVTCPVCSGYGQRTVFVPAHDSEVPVYREESYLNPTTAAYTGWQTRTVRTTQTEHVPEQHYSETCGRCSGGGSVRVRYAPEALLRWQARYNAELDELGSLCAAADAV